MKRIATITLISLLVFAVLRPWQARAETVSGSLPAVRTSPGGTFTFSISPSPAPGGQATFTMTATTAKSPSGGFGVVNLAIIDQSRCFPASEQIDYRNQRDVGEADGPQYALRPGIIALTLENQSGEEDQPGRWRGTVTKTFPTDIAGKTCQFALARFTGTFGISQGSWVQPITPSLIISRPSLTVTVSPTSVTSGQSFTLDWSSANATSISTSRSPTGCPDAGSLSPVASGSKSLTAQTVTTSTTCVYTATATGPRGTETKTASVTINPVSRPPILGGVQRVMGAFFTPKKVFFNQLGLTPSESSFELSGSVVADEFDMSGRSGSAAENYRLKFIYDNRINRRPPPGFALFVGPPTAERNP